MGLCAPVGAGMCVFKSTSSETRPEPQPLIVCMEAEEGRLPASGPARVELRSCSFCPENNTRAEGAANPLLFLDPQEN